MNIGLSYITQIRGGDDTGQQVGGEVGPEQTNVSKPSSLGGWIALTFNQLVASIVAGYHKEHNTDDSHSTIHATGSVYERGRTVAAMGEWVTIPVVPSQFTASGALTWTVTAAEVTSFAYMLVGKTMTIDIAADMTALGGVASGTLFLPFPSGFRSGSTRQYIGLFEYNEGGAYGTGTVVVQNSQIQLFKAARVAWNPAAATLDVHGQFSFEVG